MIHRPVLEGVRRVLAGEAAERVVDHVLRQNRGWTAEVRTAAVEALFGVSLWRRRLAYQAGLPDPRPEWARDLLYALLHGLGRVEAESAAGAVGLERPFRLRALPVDWPTRFSFPTPVAQALSEALGPEAEAFAEAVSLPGPVFVRTNTLLISREALIARLGNEGIHAEVTLYSPVGLRLAGRPNLWGSAAYREGLFEPQDEGSQLLGLLLDARPGHCVLDACAGAGGKTLLLAGQMENRGALYAYDVDPERLGRLRRRAERAGVTCVRVVPDWPSSLRADRVLVDAPCSELGALRRGPDLRFRLDAQAWAALPALQLDILSRAAALTAPGGLLLYATCTVRRAENEEVAKAFRATHPEFVLETPKVQGLDESLVSGDCFRCSPHRHGTDGFFAALFRRRSAARAEP